MKYLAIEKELKKLDSNIDSLLLKEEANTVLNFIHNGKIKEIYFNEEHCAVIIMDCKSFENAKNIINSLPLVHKGFISFQIMELNPYTGFERLEIKTNF